MRLFFCTLILLTLSISLFAQTRDTVIIPEQARKNFLFAELGGATVIGINYERVFYNNKKIAYAYRLGLGMNTNFRFRNIIVIGITSQYKINIKWYTELGLYPQLWVTYNPNPTTKSERNNAIQNDLKYFGTPYMPPIMFTSTLYAGLRYNITHRVFIKTAYTPYLSFYSTPNKTIKTYYNNYASISFGFSF